jgi:hypothetical protein
MPAAAAVSAYMVKVEGSMLVLAANMPGEMQRKSRKACETAGRYRRATALRSEGTGEGMCLAVKVVGDVAKVVAEKQVARRRQMQGCNAAKAGMKQNTAERWGASPIQPSLCGG